MSDVFWYSQLFPKQWHLIPMSKPNISCTYRHLIPHSKSICTCTFQRLMPPPKPNFTCTYRYSIQPPKPNCTSKLTLYQPFPIYSSKLAATVTLSQKAARHFLLCDSRSLFSNRLFLHLLCLLPAFIMVLI